VNEMTSPEADPTGQAFEVPANQEAGTSADNMEGISATDRQLADAQAERDSFRDKWTRSLAEFENYRKRVQREQEEDRKYQSLPIIRAILPAMDGLTRALQAAEKSGQSGELMTGVQMVAKQFETTLVGFGAKRIDSLGQPFDPNLHEAIQQIPSADHPPMTVMLEVEAGYTLHDRVIRPAKVLVSSAPPAE
jgi:molecular chaperone GrpE